jgi:ribosomal-protein-alanine N-acetyltransferase
MESSTAAHWSEAQYEALFDKTSAERVVRIAKDDGGSGTVLGFFVVRCLADEWEVENVVVDPILRRRGIGSCLVADLIASARAASVSQIRLEVRDSNVAARRLYERNGFSLEGRRKDYYRDPAEDALLYGLVLHFCDKIP